jgi:hypothetical protein
MDTKSVIKKNVNQLVLFDIQNNFTSCISSELFLKKTTNHLIDKKPGE